MARPIVYDWDELFKRGRFTLVRGKDYHCSTSSIIQIARNQASKRGLPLSIEDGGNRVAIEVKEKEHA